jgi:hypothetical protein
LLLLDYVLRLLAHPGSFHVLELKSLRDFGVLLDLDLRLGVWVVDYGVGELLSRGEGALAVGAGSGFA